MDARAASLSIPEWSLLRTVLYSSLFHYPLTLEEVHRTLLECNQEPDGILSLYRSSRRLRSVLDYQAGYFFPRGRSHLIAERKKRELHSRAVLQGNRLVLKLICSVPHTRVVALSGSTAHLNMDGAGDIDLFIVTSGKHVWSVAVSVLLLSKLLGRRKDICFNFVVSDQRLETVCRDLFSANQLIHLKPLIDDGIYRRLVTANPCVSRFYPNYQYSPNGYAALGRPGPVLSQVKRLLEQLLAPGPGRLLEFVSRRLYRGYLRTRKPTWATPEGVIMEDDCLKLHSRSHYERVMGCFEEAIAEALSGLSAETGELK